MEIFNVDAKNQGGLARYINHSWQPNCMVDRWKVLGITRLVLSAIREIAVGEELTIDYKWNQHCSRPPTKCYCLAPTCQGTTELSISQDFQGDIEFDNHVTDVPNVG